MHVWVVACRAQNSCKTGVLEAVLCLRWHTENLARPVNYNSGFVCPDPCLGAVWARPEHCLVTPLQRWQGWGLALGSGLRWVSCL